MVLLAACICSASRTIALHHSLHEGFSEAKSLMTHYPILQVYFLWSPLQAYNVFSFGPSPKNALQKSPLYSNIYLFSLMLTGLVTLFPVAKPIHSVLHVCLKDSVNITKILTFKEYVCCLLRQGTSDTIIVNITFKILFCVSLYSC